MTKMRRKTTPAQILSRSGFDSYKELTYWAANQLDLRTIRCKAIGGSDPVEHAVYGSEITGLFKAHFGLTNEEAKALLQALLDMGLVTHVYGKHLTGGPIGWVLGSTAHPYCCTRFNVY